MNLHKKTDEAKVLLKSGRFKEALAIIKTFRLGFNKEEKRCIQIAYESLSGHEQFYRSLGIDVDKVQKDTYQLLIDRYL